MRVTESKNTSNVRDLTKNVDEISDSRVTRKVSYIKNTPCTLPSANNNSGKEGECSLRKSGLFKESTPQSVTNNESHEGIYILIETYRKCSMHPDDIESLTHTCHDLKKYIINSEKEKIIKGKPAHNTAAAMAACKELNAYSIGLSNVELFGLTKNPSSRRGNLQVNGENIHSLYQIADSDHNSRTLEMFTRAGILHKDILIKEFGTVNEDVLTKKIIDREIDALGKKKKDESSIKEIEKSVYEAFSTLKSDPFITEWLLSGYSVKEEHRNCISVLGKYINFQHSDFSEKDLSHIDFMNVDLTGSSFNNCYIYKCDLRAAVLDGVTMNNTYISDCNGYRDEDGLVARQLIDRGVEGINLSDYSSDED